MSHPQSLPTLETRPEDAPDAEAGFGTLKTDRGHLPLESIDVRARVDGLLSRVEVAQTFVNATDQAVEATYIFPLPDRSGVTGFVMEVAGRRVVGKLDERGRARETYEQAVTTGRRAAIAEEERPGVFTLRVGNLMPGDRAVVRLTLSGTLPYADGEVTFRFPLVVAPRYVPGVPLPGPSVGGGVASDTDAAPDASRVSPPVLLKGFPNPVRLGLSVDLQGIGPDPEATGVRSSLHAVWAVAEGGGCRVTLQPGGGDRLDRDFILRFRLGGETVRSSVSFHPDPATDGGEEGGTFAVTVVPPASADGPATPRPRDMVFVLDRSGSMEGWKIVAARRALARMVDALNPSDRFALIVFDNRYEGPPSLGTGLVPATDRCRFRAVEYLAGIEARGGTEMAAPLTWGAGLLADAGPGRDRVLVLVTDGQVANEDQILGSIAPKMKGVRAFTLGIDRAVNEGFLNRLAAAGGPGGGCELVESEERLDEVLESIHRRVGSPVLTGLRLAPEGWEVAPGSLVPDRASSVFAGSPVLVLGRYLGRPGPLCLKAETAEGAPWSASVAPAVRENPAIAAAWARGQVRKLEDLYLTGPGKQEDLASRIVETSLKFGVLSRFTTFAAVDEQEVVNPGGSAHQVTQPVSRPSGWDNDKSAHRRVGTPKRAFRDVDTTGTPSPPASRAWPASAGLPTSSPPPASPPSPALPPPPASRSRRARDGHIGFDFSKFKFFHKEQPVPEIDPGDQTDHTETSPVAAGGPDDTLPLFDIGEPSDTVVMSAPDSGDDPPAPGDGFPPRFTSLVESDRGVTGPSFRAFDRELGRPVRVKIPLQVPGDGSGATSQTLATAYRDLAQRIRDTGQPTVVGPIDVLLSPAGDRVLIIYEEVDGRSLQERLRQPARITARDAAELVLRLAEVLADVHRSGLSHGDLKPSNILILADGSFRLTGLGESAVRASLQSKDARVFLGTPAYMAPEQVLGVGTDRPPVDVFALGLILYELLTGRLPFRSSSVMEQMRAILKSEPTPPRSIDRNIPKDLEAICLKALTKDPDARPTADAIAADLRRYLGEGRPKASRKRFWK